MQRLLDVPIPDLPGVVVRRSARRRRTVAALREEGRTVVVVPAAMPDAEVRAHAVRLLARLEARDRRRHVGDEDLRRRAAELSGRYLQGRARPTSVRWVDTMARRWGSCTTADGAIRLSSRLRGAPAYVVDHVLLHELAHLLVAGHGPRFAALMAADPHRARAEAFLAGAAFGEAGYPAPGAPAAQDPPPAPDGGCGA